MNKRTWALITTGVVALFAALLGTVMLTQGSSEPPPTLAVSGIETGAPDSSTDNQAEDIEVATYEGIEQLRAAFNADEGHPRLILLVDPI